MNDEIPNRTLLENHIFRQDYIASLSIRIIARARQMAISAFIGGPRRNPREILEEAFDRLPTAATSIQSGEENRDIRRFTDPSTALQAALQMAKDELENQLSHSE